MRSDAFRAYRQTNLAKSLLASVDLMVLGGSLSREAALDVIKGVDASILKVN